MIQIDLEIPKCCDECKFVYDCCKCIITGSRIDWEKSDSERLPDCPLNKIAEPKTEQFAKWVASEIFDEMWEYNQDAFAEIACRKLEKLGIVRAKGDEWELVESKESDHKCHTCKHYTSGEHDGSCGSYICKGYSDWESEDKE